MTDKKPTKPVIPAALDSLQAHPAFEIARRVNEAQRKADRLIDLLENDPTEFLNSSDINPLTAVFLLGKKGNQEIQDKVMEIIKAEKSRQAKARIEAHHNKPGGSREKREKIRQIWASGKYDSRDRCAEEESRELGMSYATARKALRNTPNPTPKG